MHNLLDLHPEQWDLLDSPSYRRTQLCQWVFERRATSFEEMHTLPKKLRAHLSSKYTLRPLELAQEQGSEDTTLKFLWKLQDEDFIESVLIPANPGADGARARRFTLCISSQVGCAFECRFCASGLEGWKRNLTPGEIVAQVIEAERIAGIKINNLVFMGMGEPLANLTHLMHALETITAPWGLHIGARHITISTSGLVPQIRKLAEDPRQFRLAISLHGATDNVRNRIMPINERFPLTRLMEACAEYSEKKQRRVSLEYILIKDLNDDLTQATYLAQHAKRLKAKVNLIPYNTVEGLPWTRPDTQTIKAFETSLRRDGVRVTTRLQKGHDIDAACGQLRLKKKVGLGRNPQGNKSIPRILG